jgi:hypothetical protein
MVDMLFKKIKVRKKKILVTWGPIYNAKIRDLQLTAARGNELVMAWSCLICKKKVVDVSVFLIYLLYVTLSLFADDNNINTVF